MNRPWIVGLILGAARSRRRDVELFPKHAFQRAQVGHLIVHGKNDGPL